MSPSTAPPRALSLVVSGLSLVGIVVVWQLQGALGQPATAQAATGTGQTTVMVMKHLCPSSIHTLAQFQTLEAQAADETEAFIRAETTCPVIRNPNNVAASGAIAGQGMAFGFDLVDRTGMVHPWTDGAFVQQKICESAVNRDMNNDGTISASTCYDTSHYDFSVPTGPVTVIETSPPAGAHFGAVRFTPPALAPNNDAASLTATYAANGVIVLNTDTDADHSVMLHVYNFGGSGALAGDTGSGSSLSSSSMSSSSTSSSTAGVPTCLGRAATIYVNGNNRVVGGPMNGQPYTGTLQGTGGPDVIVGTTGSDHVIAMEGNDVICGMGGTDHLQGDQDNDVIVAGSGASTLEGGQGNDTLIAADSATMRGGSEDDLLCGGTGAGYLNGEDGDDRIDGLSLNGDEGGNGNDLCAGGAWQANCEQRSESALAACGTLRNAAGFTAVPSSSSSVSTSAGGASSASSTSSSSSTSMSTSSMTSSSSTSSVSSVSSETSTSSSSVSSSAGTRGTSSSPASASSGVSATSSVSSSASTTSSASSVSSASSGTTSSATPS